MCKSNHVQINQIIYCLLVNIRKRCGGAGVVLLHNGDKDCAPEVGIHNHCDSLCNASHKELNPHQLQEPQCLSVSHSSSKKTGVEVLNIFF
jgi:hypothetical protein